MKKILITIAFILAIPLIGIAIAIATPPGEWHQNLVKPFYNPPNWLFGPVWTVLYILIGWVGARTFLSAPRSPLMGLWVAQMVLNFLWSPAFFGLQSLILGLIVIVPLFFVIIAFIVQSLPRDRLSAFLFMPYAAWVGFATILNAGFAVLN